MVAMLATWWALTAEARKDPVEPDPPVKPEVADAAEAPPIEAGSLWNEVQARRLMGLDAGARQIGDLVTVLIVEETSTTLDADTNLDRSREAAA
ncbi:MAG: flagellar basal body L-ring protein FlgH, partial [Myxococcota bacterium]